MTLTQSKRRLLYVCLALLVIVPVATYASRLMLAGWALRGALEMAGADKIRFRVKTASPWRLVFEELNFRVRTQSFAARRLAMERDHWWQPTLGAVRVEGMKVALLVDGSDTNPWEWSSYQGGSSKVSLGTVPLPLEKLSVEGQVVVQAATLEEKPVEVKFSAQQDEGELWVARIDAQGEGLKVKADGHINQSSLAVDFVLTDLQLEVSVWQQFIQRMVLLPGGPWTAEGQISATAKGNYDGKKLVSSGEIHIRNGRAKDGAGRIDAQGIEVDLPIDDIWEIKTKPGSLRIREASSGKLKLQNADVEFAFDTGEKIIVTKASLESLGGKVTTSPFNYYPNLREGEVTVAVDNLSVEQIMALTDDLPAKASGRVSGMLPLRIDDSGVRLGTGWLELKKNTTAEVQFDAQGLLTAGVAKNNPSYAILSKIEAGLLRLRLDELRLDIRPPNSPPGRSAQLRIKGSPTDPAVKAPVNLDLNVNGPIESLINLGLGNKLSLGTKPSGR